LQLAFDESCDRDVFEKAFSVRAEYVLAAVGVVRERTSKNKEIPTGDVELEVQELRVFSKSETPPFAIEENSNVKEDTRLKYRYLDLRRPDMQKKIIGRHRIVKLHTIIMMKTALLKLKRRTSLNPHRRCKRLSRPSRMFPGNFFALPQSPQLYKQLLMLSGFDRYMQIARCFRDEDLRADRQPEFTQIDFEMSFVNQEDVMGIAEGFIEKVYREILGIKFRLPLRRMTWQEGMERFGSDKPDLRFGMELTDVSECLKDTEFKVFSGALKTGSVRGINLKGQAQALSRKEIDKLGEWVKSYGAKGLAWTRLAEKETSSFEKFLKAEEVGALRKKMDAQPGDVLFFVADPKNKVVFDTLGALRCELAHRFNLIDDSKPCLLWITDFPLFEYSEEEGRFMAMHHPFTMPNPEDLDKLESDPGSVRALAYDMVLNGNEVGGGSIRINDSELQRRMFKALGFTPEEAQRRFGFLIDAFRYGAPPHGGMAFGLDRLVMLMLNCDSIRDVIAFPKVASSAELMSEAPTEVDQKQLNELGIQIAKQK
jgi:aspartyl-tRNA synthetase